MRRPLILMLAIGGTLAQPLWISARLCSAFVFVGHGVTMWCRGDVLRAAASHAPRAAEDQLEQHLIRLKRADDRRVDGWCSSRDDGQRICVVMRCRVLRRVDLRFVIVPGGDSFGRDHDHGANTKGDGVKIAGGTGCGGSVCSASHCSGCATMIAPSLSIPQ